MTGESHRMLREQIGAYALGQLSGQRWRAVHAHLEVCAACRADLDEIAPVAGMLAESRAVLPVDELAGPASEPAAPALSDELLAQVRHASEPVPGPTDLGAARRARRRLPVAAAAAAAVVLAGGIGYAVGGSDGIPREAVAVRALDPGIRAQADLVPHTWGMEVQLTASGFAPGATYVVTVIADDGSTSRAGEFIGTGEAELDCNLNSAILRADAASVQVAGPDGQVVLDAVV